MSYAIEAKKRKFDRILESLTDGSSPQPRASLKSPNNALTVSLVNGTTADASKRRRVTPTSLSASSKAASITSLTGHYLPSSRQAFLERLETYRQVTKWHVPSIDAINASAWVKRGWICVDTDTVFCGSCKERLTIDLEVLKRPRLEGELGDDDEDDYKLQKEVYEGLVERYQQLIVTAHADSCPWRKRGCDSSIQRIEGLLNATNTVASLKSRYDSLSAEMIPPVAPLPHQQYESEMSKLKFECQKQFELDHLRLAVCGWQKKSEDVIGCQYCFRSLGLWLYRGDDPTMDKLDPVASHLEYCPWVSAKAQDTEISLSSREGSSIVQKVKVPGYALVCQAISKDNAKKVNSGTKGQGSPQRESRPGTSETMTSEQREKRRLDLLRRIKDLKKPFKVKNLLRKKGTAKPHVDT
jgi:hypothetical protein